MSAFFITATGTDIGKTFVTSGLIRHLRAKGQRVAARKPVISGFDDPAPSDSGQLLAALGEAISPETLDRISPWRFKAALSPDMAAACEDRVVDFDTLINYSRAPHEGTLFIEGIGGIMVPLDGEHTVLDWMAVLGLPVILVTGTYLGTLSHTLTALRVLAQEKLSVAALVVNESVASTVSLPETVATLRRFSPQTPLVTLTREGADFALLADRLGLA